MLKDGRSIQASCWQHILYSSKVWCQLLVDTADDRTVETYTHTLSCIWMEGGLQMFTLCSQFRVQLPVHIRVAAPCKGICNATIPRVAATCCLALLVKLAQ